VNAGLLHATPRTRPLPEPISLDEAVRRSRLAREEREGLSGYVQGTLTVDFASASDESLFGPQRTVREDLPDPAVWASRITHALLEVMTGLRPAPQVVRWTSPEVYAVIARRSALAARRAAAGNVPRQRERLRVTRVRVCEPADGIAEAAVVVQHGARVRAVALRLEGQDGKWRITALQIG
jgi:hypothetical protein